MTIYHKAKLLKQLARFKLDALYCFSVDSREKHITDIECLKQNSIYSTIDRNLTSIEKQLKRL